MKSNNPMPDITSGNTSISGPIEWVGMKRVQSAVLLDGNLTPCLVDVGVSLIDTQAKGIHMSRLYRIINELANAPLSSKHLNDLCQKALETHGSLSNQVKLDIRFDLLSKRRSLLSDNEAFRHYPVNIHASLNAKGFSTKLTTDVYYSSACPCSETLSRQVFLNNFQAQFTKDTLNKADVANWITQAEGIYAVPHSQRSIAHVEVSVSGFQVSDIHGLIVLIEKTLKTAVQATVKREDEQAFAKLNGENLMFCEDALRKLNKVLLAQKQYSDFMVEVTHKESLHPHNAVAYTHKDFNDTFR